MAKKIFFIAILFVFAGLSCSKDNKIYKAADLSVDLKEAGKRLGENAAQEPADSCDIMRIYALPVPLDILQNSGLTHPDLGLLLPVDSSDRYMDLVSKSFAYGAYLADLAYVLSFDRQQEFIKYFDVCMSMSKDLNINTSITYQYLKRLSEEYNKDSAEYIVEQAVEETCNYIETNRMMNILPGVIAGSWVESMYLLTGTMLVNSDIDERVFDLVYEQAAVSDSIRSLFEDSMIGVESFHINNRYQEFVDDISGLHALYDTVYVTGVAVVDRETLKEIFNYYKKLRQSFL